MMSIPKKLYVIQFFDFKLSGKKCSDRKNFIFGIPSDENGININNNNGCNATNDLEKNKE